MAHTPGPWTVGDKRGVWVGPVVMADDGKRGVAFVCGESDGNATLIAAAPDLLRELQKMLVMWEAAINYADERLDAGADARNAIAKAKGEAI